MWLLFDQHNFPMFQRYALCVPKYNSNHTYVLMIMVTIEIQPACYEPIEMATIPNQHKHKHHTRNLTTMKQEVIFFFYLVHKIIIRFQKKAKLFRFSRNICEQKK